MSKCECQHSPRTAALLVTPVIRVSPHCPPPPLPEGEGPGLPSEPRAFNKGLSSLWETIYCFSPALGQPIQCGWRRWVGEQGPWGRSVCCAGRGPKVAVMSDNDNNNNNNNNNTLSTSSQSGHSFTESGNSSHCKEAWHD